MKSLKVALIVILSSVSTIAFSQTRKMPPMTGAYPNIVSSAWHLFSIYSKAEGSKTAKPSGNMYIFCKATHWEVVPPSGIGPRGDYKVKGNKLTIIYSGGKEIAAYVMSWNAKEKVLALDGGGVIMLLEYRGATTCK